MAWFGDSLSSLSNLKGQITNFTKEVLSEGIVEEADDRSKALKEANEKCSQLQDLLTTKDAEISLLRRQNCELQRAVIEINAKSKESNDTNHVDETEGVFWDPSCVNNRNAKNQNHVRQLQEELAQATVKVSELECELKHVQMISNTSLKDDIPDGHQRAEVLRAKQDMMNRIIQIEEKTREAERNAKRIQLDEATLINDFRSVISKLNSHEKFDLVSGALKALQMENETHERIKDREKLYSDEKSKKTNDSEYNLLTLRRHPNAYLEQSKSSNTTEEFSSNKEETLQKKIEELQNENKNLLESMEKLDEEHTQSIEKLLSLKEECCKKHRSLQNTYEQLSIDYNEAQKRIIELQNNGMQLKFDENTCVKTDYQSVEMDNIGKSDKHVQVTFPSQGNDLMSETHVLDNITQKVKTILKNYTISTNESEESIFETIAKQYVDAKWKLDVLERKVTEVTRNLKETEEIKDGLQIECEEMHSHIDALLLENRALKSILPSIPEASEEQVASLETDVEFLQAEVKRLSVENKTIREANSGLILTLQSKGISCTTNNNHSEEDANREIHLSLEENNVLQTKIKLSENIPENVMEQKIEAFSTQSEKDQSLDEDIILSKESKLDHENIRQELKFTSKMRSSENKLIFLQNTIDELTKENENLSHKKKQLEMEMYELQEQNDTDELLNDLQNQLDKSNNDKFDLLNDILCKTKELDEMQIQIDTKQCYITKLNQDNDRLSKENMSLLEQLTATHDESVGKIELLNTEMLLLQQEYEDLKKEMLMYKEELVQVKEKLRASHQHYSKIEADCNALKLQCEQLVTEKEDVQSIIAEKVMKIRDLENELSLKESVIEESCLLQNKCKLLEQEIDSICIKKTRLSEFQENIAELSSANLDKINEKQAQLDSTQDNLEKIEGNILRPIKMIGNESLKYDLGPTEKTNQVMSYNNEQQKQLELILDEEKREKSIIKEQNEKLTIEVTELRKKLQNSIENNKESAEMAKQTIEDLSHLVRDKDNEINVLQAEITRTRGVIAQASSNVTAITKQKDELEQLIAVKHKENLHYQEKIEELSRHANEQAIHIQKGHKYNEIDGQIIEDGRQKDEIVALNEKCSALEAAFMQEQSNNRILQNQLVESQRKEANAAKELERLRTHLVEMESSYTEEAIIAEKTREELEARLLQAEEKVKNSSTAYTSANIRAYQQVETLQQQMALIIQQRDHIQTKLSAAEDNILSHAASLTNLQIVLEQFQQDKERDIISVTEKIRSQLNESHKKQEELTKEISLHKQQLSEAKEGLQAASRLSEQLEKKDEQIERFNEEVTRLTALANSADQRIKETMERDEGKVDKTLVKNLLLGYLSSTTSDKSSILRVFATVLDFTESEKDRTGLNNIMTQNNRFLRPSNTNNAKDGEPSLSTAFVRFLENESKPKPQLPALPILNSPSSGPGYNKQQSSSAQSTLLLSNVALPTFPDFMPARNTGSILKEVLKDS